MTEIPSLDVTLTALGNGVVVPISTSGALDVSVVNFPGARMLWNIDQSAAEPVLADVGTTYPLPVQVTSITANSALDVNVVGPNPIGVNVVNFPSARILWNLDESAAEPVLADVSDTFPLPVRINASSGPVPVQVDASGGSLPVHVDASAGPVAIQGTYNGVPVVVNPRIPMFTNTRNVMTDATDGTAIKTLRWTTTSIDPDESSADIVLYGDARRVVFKNTTGTTIELGVVRTGSSRPFRSIPIEPGETHEFYLGWNDIYGVRRWDQKAESVRVTFQVFYMGNY